jgi:hypothetical protein
MFSANHAPLVSRLALSKKRPKRAFIWPTSPRSSIICPKQFSSLWYVSPNPCTYLAPRLTLSPNGPKWFPSQLHVRHKPCSYLASRLTPPCRMRWAFTWPTSPKGSVRCDKKHFMAVVHSVQTVHLSCAEINSLQMDWNKLPLDPCHVGVQSGAPKMISKAIGCSVQTVHLSCVEINTISK